MESAALAINKNINRPPNQAPNFFRFPNRLLVVLISNSQPCRKTPARFGARTGPQSFILPGWLPAPVFPRCTPSFMPFAPVVAEDDAAAVFDIGPVNRYAARFMTICCAVREEWRRR